MRLFERSWPFGPIKPRPIPLKLAHRIVEAARLTASSMNRQPWHFIVVENPDTLQQLGARARTGPYLPQAAMAVVVIIGRTQYAVSDASRAIQSMILTAWPEGLASNWVGFFGLEDVKPVLRIPANLDGLAIIPFGYPIRPKAEGHKKRKSLQKVVHRERYGAAFE